MSLFRTKCTTINKMKSNQVHFATAKQNIDTIGVTVYTETEQHLYYYQNDA